MMPRVIFTAKLFSKDLSVPASERALKSLLRTLTGINVLILNEHPEIPDIFKAGVRYKPEHHTEHWQDCLTTWRLGHGDCEDLASWYCAQLRVRHGIKAVPTATVRQLGQRTIYHALVKLPNGKLVDPSRMLGMGSSPGTMTPYNISEVEG